MPYLITRDVPTNWPTSGPSGSWFRGCLQISVTKIKSVKLGHLVGGSSLECGFSWPLDNGESEV